MFRPVLRLTKTKLRMEKKKSIFLSPLRYALEGQEKLLFPNAVGSYFPS